MLIVDLFPRVGDFADAFCRLRTQLNAGTSLFYIGVGEKAKELEWLRVTLLEELVDKVKLEGFQIPGARPFQKDVNPDLLDALPAIPITNLLVVKGDGEDRSLVLPKHLMLKWRSDEDFGEEFSSWLDKFLEKYSVGEDAAIRHPSDQIVRCKDKILSLLQRRFAQRKCLQNVCFQLTKFQKRFCLSASLEERIL